MRYICLFILLVGLVFGADYYVNTDTGTKDGDGSSGRPWSSQSQAADQIGTIAVDPNTSILAESVTIHCDGKKTDIAHVSYDSVGTDAGHTLTISCSKDYVLQGVGRWALVLKVGYIKYDGGLGKIKASKDGGSVCIGPSGIGAANSVEIANVKIEKLEKDLAVFAGKKTLKVCTPKQTNVTVEVAL